MENKKNFYVQYNEIYKDIERKECEVKLLECKRSTVVFPNMPYQDEVTTSADIKTVMEISNNDELFFLANVPDRQDFLQATAANRYYHYGCVCKMECVNTKDKSVNYICNVLYRAQIKEVYNKEGYITVRVSPVREFNAQTETAAILLGSLKERYFKYINTSSRKASTDLLTFIQFSHDANVVANLIAVTMDLSREEQYFLLAEENTEERLTKLIICINRLMSMEVINRRIDDKIREENEKRNKDAYIREKIKHLSGELEDGDEVAELEHKIRNCGMPAETEKYVLNQAAKLKKLPTMAADYSVIRNYIETIIEMPWGKFTEDNMDIANAKKVLDEDHYGLEKVKTRILEYLAVLKLKQKVSGQILCLVGAPGVGKTSIVKSIARALNRKFVKLTLGGVHDESEIRGHRKTYVGAMCGKVMSCLKTAGSSNPVFLLDEIDKLTKNNHGDPAAALLEVLDPEQNDSFKDNFLEVAFDLSKIVFIATANTTSTIPPALLDRMEIMPVDSYLPMDKLEIAKNYLIKKECAANGIEESDLDINEEVIKFLISNYTYEAGVRKLQQLIAKICRKVAVKKSENKRAKLPVTVTKQNVAKMLDIPPYSDKPVREKPEVGTAYGLWCGSYGGGILTIECVSTPGKGETEVTGNLRDVMKESVRIAKTVAKSKIVKEGKYNIDFEKINLHINCCEGAVPKEGPSAGGALTLAIYSALTGQKIKNTIAMTGEINLAGGITAIGGLREKLYACVANNIADVIVPKDNKKDIDFIPKDITEKLTIHYVSSFDEIVKLCI